MLVYTSLIHTYYVIYAAIIAVRISARHWIADSGPGIGS